MRRSLEERLWGRTATTEAGCWEFQGARDPKGRKVSE